jgi:hypothetical protein
MYDRFWSLEVTTNSIYRDKPRLKNIKENYVDNLTMAQIVRDSTPFLDPED